MNVQKVAADEACLKRLTDLRKDLDIYDLTASVPRIDALVAAIEKPGCRFAHPGYAC